MYYKSTLHAGCSFLCLCTAQQASTAADVASCRVLRVHVETEQSSALSVVDALKKDYAEVVGTLVQRCPLHLDR